MNGTDEFIVANRGRYIEELIEYLAIPSVSALPQHGDDILRCAKWTARALERAGLENTRLMQTGGNPIVYGDWLHAPGAPTILCYGHYDVQPVDPISLWDSQPFAAEVREGQIYARGATDDKGQLFIHVKAIEAHLATSGCLPINIKMIVEGEEETGGRHTGEFVRDNARLLSADAIVISDTAMFARDMPSICHALRGIACFQIDVRGTSRDLHSGSFGGSVVNPAIALAQIVSRLKDEAGRVAIPGFYDNVRLLSEAERRSFAQLPFDEHTWADYLGAPRLFGEHGYTALERMWARPALDVNGMQSGFTGDGFKTVIPATAMAKISMRLVPDQDTHEIARCFEDHVRAVAPDTVDIKITPMQTGSPWLESPHSPFMQAAGYAMKHAFGKLPIFTREGGSNPIVSVFQEALNSPTIMFGIGLPDDNAHAPNEHLDLANFQRGIIAAAQLYREIGNMGILPDN